jgi:hypothetical protein
MAQDFSFQSNIKDVQNRLISDNIRQVSNLELLSSEEAIKNVIKSYSDRFQALGGMLLDAKKYVVNSKDVIRTQYFNDLFSTIFIDLSSLYNDLELVSNVLSLNLQRNKNYFLVIKKRIRDLWNKLNLVRSYIYDSNPTDESYYEGFNNDINSTLVKNVVIDKKNGYLYLEPVKTSVQNYSHLIKNISSVTYPEKNDNGGVYSTTDILNTFEDNYKNGSRDLLQNGLWKEEILVNEIPEFTVNVGTSGVPINRTFKGVASIIDIEYVYSVELNRIDFDIFGDKPVSIDTVLYKETAIDDWKVFNFVKEDTLKSSIDVATAEHVNGKGFDIISFCNIDKIKVKYLRLVINQENYIFLNSNVNKEDHSLENQIENDLSERRYEVINFQSNLEDMISTPVNDENTSLYNSIVTIIESTVSIEDMLVKIQNVLLPQVNVIEYDFDNTIKFEIGCWAIEPKLEQYTNLVGKFDSAKFKIKDKALISVSLNTKQSIPSGTTCNWYIGVDTKNIPIVENSLKFRKEPINAVDLHTYPNFSNWTSGTFVLLDFPIDSKELSTIEMYTDGVPTNISSRKVAYLNSRLLFLGDMIDPYSNSFVIRYPASIYGCVNLYVLTIKPSISNANKSIPLGIVCTKRAILEQFIKDVQYTNSTKGLSTRTLSEDYDVTNAVALREEAVNWFGPDFSNALYVSNQIKTRIQNYSTYESIMATSNSKLGCVMGNTVAYFNGSTDGYDDLQLNSSIDNICPIPTYRDL